MTAIYLRFLNYLYRIRCYLKYLQDKVLKYLTTNIIRISGMNFCHKYTPAVDIFCHRVLNKFNKFTQLSKCLSTVILHQKDLNLENYYSTSCFYVIFFSYLKPYFASFLIFEILKSIFFIIRFFVLVTPILIVTLFDHRFLVDEFFRLPQLYNLLTSL